MSYLFFDIDGTLVTDHHDIRPSTIDSILKAKQAHHTSLLCTGRCYGMCQQFLKTFQMDSAIINNGAAIFDQGKLVISHPIKDEIVKETCQLVCQYHGSYEILGADYCYQDDSTYQLFYDFRKDHYKNDDIDQVMYDEGIRHLDECSEEIYKIDVFFPTPQDANDFQSKMNDTLQYIPAGGYTKAEGAKDGEIILKSVSKGTGIRQYIQLKNARLEDTYGFGDSNNDIGMLKTVAHPVAMRPATPEILKIAEYIANPPAEDGIYEALKHYHLLGGRK